MQALARPDVFLFADFRLDRPMGGLFRRGEDGAEVPVALGSRALDILAVLLDRRGGLVTKDEIMTAVWQGAVVEDSNLTVHIAALRRILDKDRAQGSCIQTVVGHGYRFVAEVARLNGEGALGTQVIGDPSYHVDPATDGGESLPAPEESSAALPLPDKPSIAVLPFQNMSSDPEQEFLADGIAEDVITALSRYSSLFVIARNSTFTYKGRTIDVKQIARELGVRYVLEGSLRKIRQSRPRERAIGRCGDWKTRMGRALRPGTRRSVRCTGRDQRGGDHSNCPRDCWRRASTGRAQTA